MAMTIAEVSKADRQHDRRYVAMGVESLADESVMESRPQRECAAFAPQEASPFSVSRPCFAETDSPIFKRDGEGMRLPS